MGQRSEITIESVKVCVCLKGFERIKQFVLHEFPLLHPNERRRNTSLTGSSTRDLTPNDRCR